MERFSDIVISEEVVHKKKIFVAESLELGIASQGYSVEEALKNVKEAIKLHLEENPGLIPKRKQEVAAPMLARVFL